jgi:hypothetical protein
MQTTLGGASVSDIQESTAFTPNITASIFGAMPVPGVTWGLASITAVNPALCIMSAYQIGLVPSGPTSAQLTIGSTRINPILCAAGFNVVVNATRNPVGALDALYDSSWGAQQTSCTIAVAVVASLKPPAISLCQGRTIPERENVTTKYGSVIAASTSTPTSTIYYFVNASSSSPNAGTPLPFNVDCNGTLFNTRTVYFAQAQYYNVTIRADNVNGYATASSFCSFQLRIAPQPVPPTLTTSVFTMYDLAPLGQSVGDLGLVDNNNVVAGLAYVPTAVWRTVDSPDAFSLSTSGAITVKLAVLDGLAKPTYRLTVNASDAISWAVLPVTINLLVSDRPPVIFAQTLSVLDSAVAGTQLAPGLVASHPQLGRTLTFSLTDPSGSFGVNGSTGVVYVLPGAAFNADVKASYVMTVTVTDNVLKTASAQLTVAVIETNKAPRFAAASYALSVNEYAASGAAVGAVVAVDPNGANDLLTYAIASCAPLAIGGSQCPFVINPLTAMISVAVFPGAGPLVFNASASYATPFSVTLNVTARDSGNPPPAYSNWTTVNVLIANIMPRLAPTAPTTILANLSGGQTVLNLAPLAYAAYGSARLNYSISNAFTAEGALAFSVSSLTGTVAVATFPSPTWNYNTRSVFTFTAVATDTVLAASSPANARSLPTTYTVMLAHVNQPPAFNASLASTYLAPTAVERKSGTVGSPLSLAVADPDLALGIGEALTFSILSGNTGNTFAIVPASGQLYVADNASATFIFPNVFSLLVQVQDAGIDGPRFTATARVNVTVAVTGVLPSLNFFNFSVAEHSAVGTVVGLVTGTSPTCLPTDLTCPQSVFSYAFEPAGLNINEPWPFSMSTVVAAPLRKGQISVAPGLLFYSPFRGSNTFQVYTGTVTLTETRLGWTGIPLVTTAPVQINVLWRAEPPFFSPLVTVPPASAAQLGSVVLNVYVNEHAPAGTNASFVPAASVAPYWILRPGMDAGVTPAQALATSKDPWATLAYSFTAASAQFAINAATAQVTVAATAGDLQFNTQSLYTLTARATDPATGLSDTASVRVNIVDVNDVALFTGMYNLSSGALLGSLAAPLVSVSELSAPGTPIAVVRFSDVDANPQWAAKVFSLAPWSSPFFAINASSGVLSFAPSAAALAGLDFLDVGSFVVTVWCTDTSMNSLTGSANVTVALIQGNRVTVSGFSPAPSTLNVSAFAAPATLAAAQHDVVFSTTGSTVLISGTAFGYTPGRVAREPAFTAANPLPVTATFGPTGVEFAAGACTLVAGGNTAVQCIVPAGVGFGHRWVVTVSARASPVSTRRTAFLAPTITGVAVTGGGTIPTNPLGASFIVTGFNFGPTAVAGTGTIGIVTTTLRLSYGQPGAEGTYLTATCTANTQTSATCAAQPGVGGGLSFVLQNTLLLAGNVWPQGVQSSAAYAPTSPAVSYTPPFVSALRAPAVADTRGGAIFIVNGTNLGPMGTTTLSALYSMDLVGTTQPRFTTTSCVVLAPGHLSASCAMAAGVGSGFSVLLSVLNQPAAAAFASTLAYSLPQILTPFLSGSGLTTMSTQGGAQVIVTGNFFGPAGLLLPNLTTVVSPTAFYGHTGALNYQATDCVVTVAHTQLTCLSAPGVGAALVWKVVAGGQSSAVSSAKTTSYAPPTIALYTGVGVAANTTGGEGVNIVRRVLRPPQSLQTCLAHDPPSSSSSTSSPPPLPSLSGRSLPPDWRQFRALRIAHHLRYIRPHGHRVCGRQLRADNRAHADHVQDGRWRRREPGVARYD